MYFIAQQENIYFITWAQSWWLQANQGCTAASTNESNINMATAPLPNLDTKTKESEYSSLFYIITFYEKQNLVIKRALSKI